MGSEYAKAVVDGILTGGVYALMAAGLTLIFGVMDIINIAQGIMVMLGAYLSYALSIHLGMDLFVTLLITIPALFVVGRDRSSGCSCDGSPSESERRCRSSSRTQSRS